MDWTFRSVETSICTQSEICSSIVTACIPVAKPFLDGFASGRLGNSLRLRIPRKAQVESYVMPTIESGPRAQQPRNADNVFDTILGPDADLGTTAVATAQKTGSNHKHHVQTASISSTRSDEMIIKRIDQWSVQYEDKSKISNESLGGSVQAGRSAV